MRNPASMATLPKITKNRRDVWDIHTFSKAISLADDSLLLVSMQLAFSCSMRIGEIAGLTWNDIIIDDESIEANNSRVVINKELARVSVEAMQKLKDRDILKVFPALKPGATSRLVLKEPKTESSKRTVWLPKTVAMILRDYKQEQDEMKEFASDVYNDYNLVIALDNGNPVESRVVRNRFQELCENNDLQVVVFHSLRHLSTQYKLKMTNGDVKSVQGDTGHAESEMVMDVYARIVDEDRRLNAQKMDELFYGVKKIPEEKSSNSTSDNSLFFENLLSFMSNGNNRQRLEDMMNAANE